MIRIAFLICIIKEETRDEQSDDLLNTAPQQKKRGGLYRWSQVYSNLMPMHEKLLDSAYNETKDKELIIY